MKRLQFVELSILASTRNRHQPLNLITQNTIWSLVPVVLFHSSTMYRILSLFQWVMCKLSYVLDHEGNSEVPCINSSMFSTTTSTVDRRKTTPPGKTLTTTKRPGRDRTPIIVIAVAVVVIVLVRFYYL